MRKMTSVAYQTGEVEAAEDLKMDCQFHVCDLMQAEGINDKELAQRMGVSEDEISAFFSAEAEPTLEFVAQIFFALGTPITVTPKFRRQRR